MQLSNHKEISKYFSRNVKKYISNIVVSPDGKHAFVYMPFNVLGKKASSNQISKRQLSLIKNKIFKEKDISLDFILSKPEETEEICDSLKLLLNKKFDGICKDVWVSFFEKNLVEIWIDGDISYHDLPQKETMIKASVINYLELLDIKIKAIHISGSLKTQPSLPVILRAVKILAPAKVEEICEYLDINNFLVPTMSWLQSQLDRLRKNDMIFRQEDASYVLTTIGLNIVPHGPTQNSSDIDRVLALGKKYGKM